VSHSLNLPNWLRPASESRPEAIQPPARLVALGGNDAQRLVHAANAAGIGLLITEAEHAVLQLGGLERIQEALDRPVLLVR